jgi:hypothetical protein
MQKVAELFRNVEAHVPKQRSVYSALDIVRFLTAVLVMIYHLFFLARRRRGSRCGEPILAIWLGSR